MHGSFARRKRQATAIYTGTAGLIMAPWLNKNIQLRPGMQHLQRQRGYSELPCTKLNNKNQASWGFSLPAGQCI